MKYIILILIISFNSLALCDDTSDNSLREAGSHIGQALYKQYNGEVYAQNLAELILDKSYWKYIIPVVDISKVVIDKRIVLKYEF